MSDTKKGEPVTTGLFYVLCFVFAFVLFFFADCCIGIGGKKIMSCRIPHCTALNCAVYAAGPAIPAGNKSRNTGIPV